MTDRLAAAAVEAERSPAWRFLPIGVVVAGLVFGYAMGWHHFLSLDFLAQSREALKQAVAANYVLSLAGFVLLYTVAVAFSFPAASILTVFGGFLFGWLVGGAVVAVGATAGATLLFLAARSAFGDFLKRRLGGRLARLAGEFEENAFGTLLVLRLAPVFPFFVVNIAPAFFDVRLRTYVAATFFGILPATFAYAYLGQGIDGVLVAAENAGRSVSPRELVTMEITLAFAGLALVAAGALVVRRLWSR